MADPMRFLDTFSSTNASTSDLSTFLTVSAGTMAAATTLLPRPSIQLMAAAFLSVHLANLEVELNALFITFCPSSESSHILAAPLRASVGKEIHGPLVIPSLVKTVWTPPPALMALQPLIVEATKHPSVVAIGMWYGTPSIIMGPATPTGIGIKPITFSQHAPNTLS
ncbi:hypothetical protein OGATHE_003055 [Ogataea polymorpha]|uniref:Uncharacterized protein n=1 Tax=Ogataea polymorpha TaxID=460523 RepID=A0A9P8PFD7_9ASCO|nr:hypothetical protein OGATHE_003055 [Ogataea polymorpha]